MVAPSAGAVILVSFPFSDLSRAKLRPAKLFTVNISLFYSEAGFLKFETFNDIINSVVEVLKGKPIS